MKKFEITLPDGKPIELLYTSLDAITLKKQFEKPMFQLFNVDVAHDREVQAAILTLGAKHKRPNVEEKDFLGTDSKPGWIDRYVQAGGDMTIRAGSNGWIKVARAAAYYHGIVNGRCTDLDAPDDEDEEGKGEAEEKGGS